MNCEKIATVMKFAGCIQPHYWCFWCRTLWVDEMGYLLECVNPKHLSNVGFERKSA